MAAECRLNPAGRFALPGVALEGSSIKPGGARDCANAAASDQGIDRPSLLIDPTL